MAHRGDHLRQRRSVLNMDEVTLNSWNSIAPTTRTAGQGGTAVTRFWGKLPMLAAALVITIAYTYAADTPLLEPHNLIVDRSLPREQADAQVIAARRLRQILSTRRCRPVALRELPDHWQPRS